MPLFEVLAKETVETIYTIEAETEADARNWCGEMTGVEEAYRYDTDAEILSVTEVDA